MDFRIAFFEERHQKITRLPGIGVILRIIALAFGLLLTSCAGGSGMVRGVPDWVITPPASDSANEYFVVSATGLTTSEAEEAAGASLLTAVNRVLGVDIDVINDATARGTLESYEAEVIQTVSERGSGNIAGLRIIDRYETRSGDEFLIYILASYDTADLEAERAKRQALIREQEAAVSVPEALGAEYEASGELYDAMQSYAEAAVAASRSGIRNNDVKLDRNLHNFQRVAQNLTLQAASVPESLRLGQANIPFRFRVLSRSGVAVPRAQVQISYRERNGAQSRQVTLAATSDAQGYVDFTLPAADTVGQQFLTISVPPAKLTEGMRAAGLTGLPQYQAAEQSLNDVRLRVSYEVYSLASTYPTAVVIVERDIAGNPIEATSVSDGMLQVFAEQNFILVDLNGMDSQISEGSYEDIIAWVGQRYGEQIDRLVVGSANIIEVSERDGYIVRVEGDIVVYDFVQGTIIARLTGTKNSRATSSVRAVNTAFATLGRDFAGQLLNILP